MKYWLNDASKALEAAIHRLHCRIFDDDEYGFEDYAWLYGPFVLFAIIFAITWFIVHGVG